ncbi:hypothetical protein KB553_09560 [Chryseobacterium rhizoplanae]|uniref:hypothetical protein n=1 Tax=Chryseobacterium rhizoplanae TaxID=1609531 RepID=UPI001CE26C37|nr:hypothetical protein [Chryseobacterium rhizoplanae]UCA61760.1 hypothetical protein KB553_09560 [Chryseobacterium rhizoplanae]
MVNSMLLAVWIISLRVPTNRIRRPKDQTKINDQSKSDAKAPETAAKTVSDNKVIAELKQDAKDIIDRLISVGKLVVAAETACPKTKTDIKEETTTQTPDGLLTETTTDDKK